MANGPSWHVLLLILLPIAAAGAAEGDARSAVIAAHERLDAAEPRLSGEDEAAARSLDDHCLTLNRRCLRFATDQPDVFQAALPDNPEYWDAYRTLLHGERLTADLVDPANLAPYSGFIAATNGWIRRELATRGIADPRRLHEMVLAHRQGLAGSNVLIEKMVFIATVGITLPAVNAHMAQRSASAAGMEARLLDDMLEPLSRDERSLRRTLEGELQYMRSRMEEYRDGPEMMAYQGDPEIAAAEVRGVYDFIADRSEAEWSDFWRNGVDVAMHLTVPVYYDLYPSYGAYAANLRYLDAMLHVLRAMREMYEGRVSPGPPAVAAPGGWHWRWDNESRNLCLDPGYLHASLGELPNICYEDLRPR